MNISSWIPDDNFFLTVRFKKTDFNNDVIVFQGKSLTSKRLTGLMQSSWRVLNSVGVCWGGRIVAMTDHVYGPPSLQNPPEHRTATDSRWQHAISPKKISKRRQCCLCLLNQWLQRPHTWMSDFPVPSREPFYVCLIPITKLQQGWDCLAGLLFKTFTVRYENKVCCMSTLSIRMKRGCVSNLQSIPKEWRTWQGLSVTVFPQSRFAQNFSSYTFMLDSHWMWRNEGVWKSTLLLLLPFWRN